MKKANKKKEKITYIDDGRSFADLSNVGGGFRMSKRGTYSAPKEILRTYLNATKMMIVPTIIAVGFLTLIYLIAYLAFYFM